MPRTRTARRPNFSLSQSEGNARRDGASGLGRRRRVLGDVGDVRPLTANARWRSRTRPSSLLAPRASAQQLSFRTAAPLSGLPAVHVSTAHRWRHQRTDRATPPCKAGALTRRGTKFSKLSRLKYNIQPPRLACPPEPRPGMLAARALPTAQPRPLTFDTRPPVHNLRAQLASPRSAFRLQLCLAYLFAFLGLE